MASMETLICIITGVVVIFIYRFFKRIRNLPPGPWNLPILGHLPWMDPTAVNVSLFKLSQKFGPIFGLYFGSVYTVVVSDLKLMRKVLIKDEASGRPHLYLFQHLSNFEAVLTSQGDLWKSQRRLIQHYLKSRGASNISQNREKFQRDVMTQVFEFMQNVRDKGEETPIRPGEMLNHNMASLSSGTMLNTCWPRNDHPTWKKLLHDLDRIPQIVAVGGILNFLPFLKYIPYFQKEVTVLKATIGGLIDNFRLVIDKQTRSSDESCSTLNFVDAFLEDKSKQPPHVNSFYTHENLSYLVNDIFMASIETTACTLSWCLLHLARHQQVQDKVRKELSDVVQDELPSLHHRPQLPYLEATLCESARIRTVVPMALPHCAVDDIRIMQYIIPKGTMILPLMWAVHMDAALWGDPENFRPERFIDKEGKFIKSEYIIPFGIGKRMCPGEEMAKMVIFLFVANILTNFKIECEDGSKVDLNGVCGTTLMPKPHLLKFISL